MMHLRRSIAEFSPQKQGEMLSNFHRGNLAPNPKCTRKTSIGTTPIPKPTLKPNAFKAPKANANVLFSIASLRKLRFYQNKGLSLNRRCGVPNTFPTCYQTFELKNQDFLPIHVRLGKRPFS